MAEKKERSAIFKFFYVILSVVTFPIFCVLFVLRHPFWILFLLLCIAGAAAYYPISQGVKPDEVITWYQNKYIDVQKEVVAKAAEQGATDLVPQVLLNSVKKIEEEEAEAKLPKGENYNQKVIRDKKAEETKAKIKKRGGFKKVDVAESKVEETVEEKVLEPVQEVLVIEESATTSGGLSAILKAKEKAQEANSVSEEQKVETEEIMHIESNSESLGNPLEENPTDNTNIGDISSGLDPVAETSKNSEAVTNDLVGEVKIENETVADKQSEISEDAKTQAKANNDDLELDLF